MIKGLGHEGVAPTEREREKSGAIVVQMLSKGIAPRPEHEILFEMKLLDEMKGKLDKEKVKVVEKAPMSLDELKSHLMAITEQHAMEKEVLERQV